MSDYPAPNSYINDEIETLSNPSMTEENKDYNNYNNYPENNEIINNSINTPYSKPIFSNVMTNKAFAGLGFGAGFTYFGIKEDNIGLTIGCNVFTLVGIAFCFCLKCSSMTFDMNMGIISIRICKIFYCKKDIYKIDEIEEIVFMESTNYNGLKRAGANYVYYDIVLILRGGKRVVGITKSDENADSINVYNILRKIIPQHINIVNNARPIIDNE